VKVGRDNVEMRRAVIVGVHPYADGTKALQSRHRGLANGIVQLLHFIPQKAKAKLKVPLCHALFPSALMHKSHF
jgi:hypothetical protein